MCLGLSELGFFFLFFFSFHSMFFPLCDFKYHFEVLINGFLVF